MTAKTALITLFLTVCGLWAQTPPFATLPSGASPDGSGTNRDQVLNEALHERGFSWTGWHPGQSSCGRGLLRASTCLAKRPASAAGGKAW